MGKARFGAPAVTLSAALAMAAALLGLGVSRPLTAQISSSCPIPLDAQFEAVRAFGEIASFLTTEPRCVNCHGGVNPFIKGTGSDPEDVTAPPSRTEHGGGLILRQRPTAPDGTLLIETECMDCHNNMAPKRDGSPSRWFTAPNFFSFVDKDAPTLCKQIRGATHTASDFLGHLEDDNGGNNFSQTAFNGDRGLDRDRYPNVQPEPPRISKEQLMQLAQDWLDAMDGSFHGDESCGCEVQLQLYIEHRIVGRRDTSGAQLGQPIFGGTASADMRLSPFPAGPDQFRGSITLVREMSVGHITPRCTGSATQIEEWDVIARVDVESEIIELAFNQYPEDGQGSWRCDGSTRDLVSVYVRSEFAEGAPVTMSLRSGTRQEFSLTGPRSQETLIVTVP